MQPAFELLNVLSDFAQVQQGHMSLDQSSTFMKYISMSGSPTLDKDPKFVFYSAHAETVDPVLRYFGAQNIEPYNPYASSMILFQFFKTSEGQIRVLGRFVEGKTSRGIYEDSSENFVSKIGESLKEYSQRVGTDQVPEMCANGLDTSKPMTLSSAQDFKKELYDHFGFDPQAAKQFTFAQN